MVRDTRVLFKCNVEDHPELKKARVYKSCAGRRTLSPLLVFLLLRKQEVAHRSACIPTATQLWPFEDLLLLRPRPTRLRCRLPPLLPSLRHCVHEFTAELLRNLLIRSLVEARLTRSLRLGGNIVHIDCTWVSENFKSVGTGRPTSILPHKLFHKLVTFDVVTSAPLAPTPWLAILADSDSLPRAVVVGLDGLTREAPACLFCHVRVAHPDLRAEINFLQFAVHGRPLSELLGRICAGRTRWPR